jgi:putative transposase
LEVTYQADRRKHAQARGAAFVVPPSGPNQVWQMDFSVFETRMGGLDSYPHAAASSRAFKTR